MSQPPWIPSAGGGAAGDPDDEASYRGAHSSSDETAPPAADDLWGGPGMTGPWSNGADQPWSTSDSTDPWAGAKGGWATPDAGDATGPDDSGPAFPVPGAAPGPNAGPNAGPQPAGGPGPAQQQPPVEPGAPQPWAAGPAPSHPGGAGYGPLSYGDPAGPSAGPAVGEPAFASGPPDPAGPGYPAAPPNAVPPNAGPPNGGPLNAGPGGQPHPGQPAGPAGQGGQGGEPFRAVRSEAVPPSAGPSYPPVSAADVYTPAEPPPTPRPPQPELPESMSEVPQYAARLAPAPRPEPSGPPANGTDAGSPPGWGAPPDGQPTAGQPGPGQAGPGQPGPGQPGQQPPAGQPTADPQSQYPPQQPSGWPNPAPQGPVHAVGGTPPPPVMPRPEDLLVHSRPRTLEKPATWGWRGRLARMSGGMYKPKPSTAELADRQAKLNAQRGFSRPMTVVVIQPKGGAGKTPTTICVASALGVRRGGYIVGWDNNETRGTLAVRTTNDDNQRTTAWDLLGRLDEFERSEARVGDLSYYMRAQGDAQFDALVSDDNPGNMAQIGEVEFKRIHQVLQRFYRMIIIDTGNNVRSTNWQAAVDHADQIVVVSTYQRDVGYSGSWVLDHLAQTGRDELARDAITVLTAAEPTVDDTVKGELVKHFGARTRAVVEVPYDPHIAEGGPIRWDELSEGSKRAWTGVAAAITQTLYERDQRQLASTGRPGG